MESPGKVSLHKKEELGLVSRHHIPTCKIIRLAGFNKRNPQFEWLDAYKYCTILQHISKEIKQFRCFFEKNLKAENSYEMLHLSSDWL